MDDQRRALAEHYTAISWHPSLAELAEAAARLDGNPLADDPDLLARAAAADPAADPDEVLALAARMSAQERE